MTVMGIVLFTNADGDLGGCLDVHDP
uniref:Uncharacterized protein n=1 Tax=Ralstonia solanacearum TaxID=305 RepID=A0A0S4X3V2_RALSL|nr:protein of unknown function [Ralstonia solanacearum]